MSGNPMNVLTPYGQQRNFGSWLKPATSVVCAPSVDKAQMHLAKLQGVLQPGILPQFDADQFTKDPQAFADWKTVAKARMSSVVSYNVDRVARELRYPAALPGGRAEGTDVTLVRHGISVIDVTRAGIMELVREQSFTNFLDAVQNGHVASFETGSKAATWADQVGALGSHVSLDEFGERARGTSPVNAFDEIAARGGLLPDDTAAIEPSEGALTGMRVLREAINDGGLSGAQREVALQMVQDHNPAFTRMMGQLDAEGQAWFVSQFVASFMPESDGSMAYHLLTFADDMGRIDQV